MTSERDDSLTPPPPPPRLPSAMSSRRPLGSEIREDPSLIFDITTSAVSVGDKDSRPKVKHCVHGMTRRGPGGSNLDPPSPIVFHHRGSQPGFWDEAGEWSNLTVRQKYSDNSAAIDAEVVQRYFPEHVSTDVRPAPQDKIEAGMYHNTHGELPVLRQVDLRTHRMVTHAQQMLSLRDIPWSMSELDVDCLTGEIFDISGRIVDRSQTVGYHVVLRDHERALEAANYLVACSEAIRNLRTVANEWRLVEIGWYQKGPWLLLAKLIRSMGWIISRALRFADVRDSRHTERNDSGASQIMTTQWLVLPRVDIHKWDIQDAPENFAPNHHVMTTVFNARSSGHPPYFAIVDFNRQIRNVATSVLQAVLPRVV
ncbi:hypothetical protein GGG16DRAFT_103570 [Schizophyllum commune]